MTFAAKYCIYLIVALGILAFFNLPEPVIHAQEICSGG